MDASDSVRADSCIDGRQAEFGGGFDRISLVISQMGTGGAERVLSILANAWSDAGIDVQLVTVASKELDFYPLHPKIMRVGLDLTQPSSSPLSALVNNARRVNRMRGVLTSFTPDVVLSFAPPASVTTLLATVGTGLPVVVSERNDPTMRKQPLAWNALRRLVYPRAAALAVQTETVRSWAARKLPGIPCHVIPNPARPLEPRQGARKQDTTPYIVGMGRLVEQKGFDLLFKAFARLEDKEWRLMLIGDGPLRGRLEQQAEALGIRDRVDFVGQVKDPETYLSTGSVFALSSRYEGFPNALLEAMSLGIPSVSFDCRSGPSEIISDGSNGLLVPTGDTSRLASALSELARNRDYREKLGLAGAKSVRERFSIESVVSQWTNLLGACALGSRGRDGRKNAARTCLDRDSGRQEWK